MKLSLKKTRRMFSYGPRLRPERDWLVLMSGFFVLLGISLVWNVWQFSQVANGQKIGNVPVPTQSEIQVKNVQTVFTSRASERARYQHEYRFVDPSL